MYANMQNNTAQDNLWDKCVARFKRTRSGVFLLALVAAFTVLSRVTGVVDWIEEQIFSSSDLVVSSLTGPDRLIRLPGFPLIDSDLDAPLFTGGFRARFSLAHNGKGASPVKVTGIKVIVDEYKAGKFTEYSYKLDADEIIGRGVVEAKTFAVSLSGLSTEPIWIDEEGQPHYAKSSNLLDVDPPRALTFAGSSDIGEELDITVTPDKPGLYRVRFLFHYFVDRKDQKRYSSPVKVYYEE